MTDRRPSAHMLSPNDEERQVTTAHSRPDKAKTDGPLADALLDAHEFGDLAGGQPTMAPTLLRQVLLPVVLDALGPMTRDVWLRTFRARRFDAGQRDRIGGYLAEWRHRFDLFHPTAPFAQAAGLRTPSSRTRHVLATSPRRRDGTGPPAPSPAPGLRPAEAAWWLLHVHC